MILYLVILSVSEESHIFATLEILRAKVLRMTIRIIFIYFMLTLITSLYKSERYLAQYIANLKKFAEILSRNKVDFEIIVIANAPSEKEKELKEIFKNNPWFVFAEVAREPLYASWNRGVESAKNEIIGFWNVDDIRYPEAVIDGLRLLKEGAELVYFPFIIKWYLKIFRFSLLVKQKKIEPPVFERREFVRSMYCGPFFIFKKSLYEKVGPFDEQFKIVGDFDWCVRAAKITDKFVLSDKIAGVFRVDKALGALGISGAGLSGGRANARHLAENNIVCVRHGIKDKIQPADENLMKEYNSDKIVCKNK